MPYDPSTPVGQVRLLINDTTSDPVFDDSEVAAFLSMCQNSAKRAAARALEVIAADEALTSKVINTQDASANGASVADALRQLAESYRAEALYDETQAAGTPAWLFPDPTAKIDTTVVGWI